MSQNSVALLTAGQRQLYLDLFLELALETSPDDLSLTWLEAISDRRDGTDVIGHGEEDEFLVDEFGIRNFFQTMVQEGSRLTLS